MNPESVLEFWFGSRPLVGEVLDERNRFWFVGGDEADAAVTEKFEPLVESAFAGGLTEWEDEPRPRLALILVLDQFSRNIHRGSKRAFEGDRRALALAIDGIERGMHRGLDVVERTFFYLPFEHAEDEAAQARCVSLFEELVEQCDQPRREYAAQSLMYAVQHRDIVVRFGRFPHRNRVLGRPHTDEEAIYLSDGAPAFGQ